MTGIVRVDNLTMRFGGLTAVDAVTWSAEAGAIHSIIGPNGAGKTTLFNVIAGTLVPSEGKVSFQGEDITRLSPERRCEIGIARTFQIPRPFAGMSVLDNVAVGLLPHRDSVGAARRGAMEVLARLDMETHAEKLAGPLPIGLRKRLEVARALATGPKAMLLDEVMGGLHGDEVERMIETIREIRAGGVGVVMIEHVMPAVMSLADRVTVLDQGRIISSGTPKEVTQDPAVIAAYLGDEVAA